MGAALSWLVVRGKPASAVLAELGLRPTGRRSLEGEAPLVGAASADGWYLVVADAAEHRLLEPAVVGPLSRDCQVVTCTVEEHVMFSAAAEWRDGRERWRVWHRGEDGPVGLEETGTLPAEYAGIRDELQAQQRAAGGAAAEVDHLFDIPVALVRALTGYRHDAPSPAFESPGVEGLEVLERAAPAAPTGSWLGRLLGR